MTGSLPNTYSSSTTTVICIEILFSLVMNSITCMRTTTEKWMEQKPNANYLSIVVEDYPRGCLKIFSKQSN